MDVRVGLWRKLSAKELMLLNCGVGEDSWESLGLQGDPTSPFWRRSVLGVLWQNYAKAETPVLWPPHAKSWLTGKDSDAGRDWVQEEKGTTEDEMAGWHHWLDGHESEWTPGVDGQGGLVCCDSWGCKESDTTERLNWTESLVSCIICKYSPPFHRLSFHFVKGFLFCAKAFKFNLILFVYFCSYLFFLRRLTQKILLWFMSKSALPVKNFCSLFTLSTHTHSRPMVEWKKKYMSRQIGYNNFKSTSSQGNTY